MKKILTLVTLITICLSINVSAVNVYTLKTSGTKGMSLSNFEKAMNLEDIKPVYPMNVGVTTPSAIRAAKSEKAKSANIGKIKINLASRIKYSILADIVSRLATSDIAALELIGESVLKSPIYNLTIGTGEKVVMLSAGVHARETANPLYLTNFSVELIQAWEAGKKFYGVDAKALLEEYTFQIVVCANPDGYDAVQFGKAGFKGAKSNINLVDINRNFPSYSAGILWPGQKETPFLSEKPSVNYYAGKELGSEPETQAIMRWMQKYVGENTHIYIDFHSGGSIIYDSKPDVSKERNKVSQTAGSIYSKVSKYPKATDETTGQMSDGTTTDYIYSLMGGMEFDSKFGRMAPAGTSELVSVNSEIKYNFAVLTIETLKRGLTQAPIASASMAKNGGHPTTADVKNEWVRAKIPQAILETLKYR